MAACSEQLNPVQSSTTAKIRDTMHPTTDEIATKLCGHRCGSYLVSLACPVFPSDSWPISRHSGQVAFRQTTGRSPAPESMLFHPGTDQYGELTENATFQEVRRITSGLPVFRPSG